MLAPTDSNDYRITTQHGGRVLEVVGGTGATGDGAKLSQWDNRGGSSQQWKPVQVSTGVYKFLARHSGKAMDVPGCSTTNSVQLQQYADSNNVCQQFRFQWARDD